MGYLVGAKSKKIPRSVLLSTQETLTKAIAGGREWQGAQEIPQPKIISGSQQQSRIDRITCRSDAAWRPGTLAAGVAWSFYSINGEMITSQSKLLLYVNSPLVTEGLAMREAMVHALFLGFNRVNFESDSMNLVAAIVNGGPASELHGIVSDISLCSSVFFLGIVIIAFSLLRTV